MLCLLAVVLLAYFNIVFLGETLSPSGNHSPIDYRVSPIRQESTQDPLVNWHDLGGAWWQWEPAGQFFGRSYRGGVVPMWDPTAAAGVNSHVNVTQAQYFLPYVLVLLAGGSPLLFDIYHLLMLFASGVACFVLLRRNGFHWTSSVFMGAGWMLSGAMTQNVSTLLGQTCAMLPLFVLSVDVLLDRLTWRALGAAALVVGLGTYSSFLPIIISGYVLIGLQTLAYAYSAASGLSVEALAAPLRRTAAFGAAVAIAIGLAAFVLLPLAAAQHGSEAFHSWYSAIGKMHYSPDLLLTLLSPRLSYDVWQTQNWTQAFIPKLQLSSTHFFYVGFVVVLLLPLLKRDHRPRVRRLTLFFAVAALLLFLKLMGIPPVQWVAYLPVFRFLHYIPYFSAAFNLALIGLAACALETLVRTDGDRRRFFAVAALAVTLIAAVIAFVLVKGYNSGASLDSCVRYFLELDRIFLVVCGLTVITFFRVRGSLRGPVAGVLVVGLLLLELLPIAFHRRYQRADVWADVPEYVRFLKLDKEPFRIHSTHPLALTPNAFQGVGVSAIASRGVFNQSRYTLFIQDFFETERDSGFIRPSTLLPKSRSALDVLNVKYLVTFDPTQEERDNLRLAGFKKATTDGSFLVFSNPRVWPRAFVAHDYRVVADVREALTAVGDRPTTDVAILEQQPVFASSALPASPCTLLEDGPNRVTISGATFRPGVLVLLDAFGPGWTAAVNGRSAPLIPAYAAFRGVEVPPGKWEVTMRYESPLAREGLLLSILSLALAVVALGVPRRLPGGGERAMVHEGDWDD